MIILSLNVYKNSVNFAPVRQRTQFSDKLYRAFLRNTACEMYSTRNSAVACGISAAHISARITSLAIQLTPALCHQTTHVYNYYIHKRQRKKIKYHHHYVYPALFAQLGRSRRPRLIRRYSGESVE